MSDEPTTNFEAVDSHISELKNREHIQTNSMRASVFGRYVVWASVGLLALGVFIALVGFAFYLAQERRVEQTVTSMTDRIVHGPVETVVRTINGNESSDSATILGNGRVTNTNVDAVLGGGSGNAGSPGLSSNSTDLQKKK